MWQRKQKEGYSEVGFMGFVDWQREKSSSDNEMSGIAEVNIGHGPGLGQWLWGWRL